MIVGNWKMNGAPGSASALAKAIAAEKSSAEIVLCPPFTLLSEVSAAVKNSGVALGAQDCHFEREGAYTGDISASMLAASGCKYVIVGHSERRTRHGETSDLVAKKAEAAQAAGLTPIICIGETLAEREAGKAESVVKTQLLASIPAKGAFILAYEPVWAIGTGKTATVKDIEAMHAHIKGLAPAGISVLYGGSVNSGNAKEILSARGVNGALVGGASLKAEEFIKILGS